MERVAPRVRLLDRKFVAYYKKDKTMLVKDKVNDTSELLLIAKTIWEVTAKRLVENSTGVVLDRIGYFCNWVTPKKRVMRVPRKGRVERMINTFSGSYFYNTSIFTDVFSIDNLKGWSLDKTINRNIKKGKYHQLKKGRKYKVALDLVKRLYNKRYRQKSI